MKNDLTLAAGAPTGFSSAVINAIPALARLGRGSLTLSGNSASVHGDALYPNATKEIGLALEAAFGKGFTLKSEIGVASSPPLDPTVCQPSFDRLLDVGHINYATDSAVIPPEAAPLLDRLVDVAQRCRSAIVSVAGFTDATGTAEHNMDLSQRRAQSVVTYLTGAGVDKARISAIGYGKGGAVASNATLLIVAYGLGWLTVAPWVRKSPIATPLGNRREPVEAERLHGRASRSRWLIFWLAAIATAFAAFRILRGRGRSRVRTDRF